MVVSWNFGTKFFKGGKNVRPEKKLKILNLARKGKMVILLENLYFFKISDDEIDFTVESSHETFSRNLVTQTNFVKFRDRWIFLQFRGNGRRVDPKNDIFRKIPKNVK